MNWFWALERDEGELVLVLVLERMEVAVEADVNSVDMEWSIWFSSAMR